MSMIRADHLTFSYAGAQPVFEDVGFVIDTEWMRPLRNTAERQREDDAASAAGGQIRLFGKYPCFRQIQLFPLRDPGRVMPDQRGPADDRSVCAGVGDAAGTVLACA